MSSNDYPTNQTARDFYENGLTDFEIICDLNCGSGPRPISEAGIAALKRAATSYRGKPLAVVIRHGVCAWDGIKGLDYLVSGFHSLRGAQVHANMISESYEDDERFPNGYPRPEIVIFGA